ncbi:PIN domain-containing protein [Sphingopyxis indica]|uniref:Ribonuclease VapC n=1 Tax=Sphingopyxis indica TaxID=436663 RepID=A0A239DEN7_9SPHN|nr:PIN domain-containing protein [Sphingopyxis indica]SNS30820.1 Predicted nucleic acid-binding protein, contains PIN domain [Sphingopyxis indica]
MPGSFLDTNVLLYQLSNDLGKAERAEALVREGGTISVQVLNELANVARRKIGLAWTEVQALTETLRALLNVVPLDADMHAHGLRLCERNGFSVYDGMIVAAALSAGCDTLWSEDMHAGLKVEGRLTIRNPFVI